MAQARATEPQPQVQVPSVLEPCSTASNPTPVFASRQSSFHPATTPSDAPTLLTFHIDTYRDVSTSPELEVVSWAGVHSSKTPSFQGQDEMKKSSELLSTGNGKGRGGLGVGVLPNPSSKPPVPGTHSSATPIDRPPLGIGAVGAPTSAAAGGNIASLWKAFQLQRGAGTDCNMSNMVYSQSPQKEGNRCNSNSNNNSTNPGIFSDAVVVGISRPVPLSRPSLSVCSSSYGPSGVVEQRVPIESISRENSIAPTVLGMNSVSRSSSAAIQAPTSLPIPSSSATAPAPTCLVAKDSNAINSSAKQQQGKASSKTPVLRFTPSMGAPTMKSDSSSSSVSALPYAAAEEIKISFLRFNEDPDA